MEVLSLFIWRERIFFLERYDFLVLRCRDLLNMDYCGTSDPYIILELLPPSVFRGADPYKTEVRNNTLNPEYNQPFRWYASVFVCQENFLFDFFKRRQLPRTVLSERGAVLRFSVWDKYKIKKDDFIGECFVSLPDLYPMKNLASIRDVPVSEMRLRKTYKNQQPKVFQVKFSQ